jgi:hypothetical protein
MISVLRDSHDCVGFLRNAGPRGFTAYDADGQPLGASTAACFSAKTITDLNSSGDQNGNL